MLAVGVGHVPGADIGVVEFQVCALVELEAEQAGGGVEGGRDHRFQFEVLADFGFVQVKLLAAHLFGVVAPVPGGDFEVAAF